MSQKRMMTRNKIERCRCPSPSPKANFPSDKMAQNIQTLQNQLLWARKQKSYAWAKYYESINRHLVGDRITYQIINRTCEEMPTHIKNEFKEMAMALKKKWECPICLDFIADDALEITNCGHFYCKPCLKQLIETQKTAGDAKWECATCRKTHNYKDE